MLFMRLLTTQPYFSSLVDNTSVSQGIIFYGYSETLFMKKNRKLIQPIIAILCVFFSTIFICGKNDGSDKTEAITTTGFNYKWYTPPLPQSIDFAGEKVPLERWDVREQFDKQLIINYYWQGNILYIIKLSQRYFPIIEERLKANNVPDDMKYLCVAESNLQNQVSRAGAAGFWQFMRGTAPAFGLEVSNEVDERYHVIKSTDAACKYLKQAYDKLGSWTAAAASYNCGQGGYNSTASIQKTGNYYDLLLPDETNNYLFRILTFKYLISTANKMGFIIPKEQGYGLQHFTELTVSKSIPNLVSYAIDQGTTYKMLKLCNPWLRGKSLSVRAGKTYTILLPVK
jgi:membrane-bound lytic murein transglycosylase D